MTADQPAKPRLAPARPTSQDESEAYLPRIPWRFVLLGAISLATVIAGYTLSERKKADALRAQIVTVHQQQLAEPARRYLAFRKKLESWVQAAASKTPDSYADKRLRFTGLRSGRGLYLRLPSKDAHSAKAIAKAAANMEADSVAACLGLAPASARGLWEKGEFLTPEWLASARKDEGVMKLRVTDEVLARHIRSDLGPLLDMLRSDWLLLAIDQGPSRREDPVDVFLWDLRRGDQLLRGRVRPSGILLSAHIATAQPQAKQALPGDPRGMAADDCSLAAQIKQLAGMPAVNVENMPGTSPAPPAGAGPTAPAPAAAAPAPPTPPAPPTEDETPMMDAPKPGKP